MPYPAKVDRRKVLDAALAQVRQGGLANLSLRTLAAELQIAPNALYRYFRSRAALEAALSQEAIRREHQLLREAVGDAEGEDAIRAMAGSYLQFAKDEPHLFALVLLPVELDLAEEPAAHVELWQFFLARVAAVYGEERAPEAAVSLWAYLEGIVTLEQAGVFGPLKPTSSVHFGLDIWLQGGISVRR